MKLKLYISRCIKWEANESERDSAKKVEWKKLSISGDNFKRAPNFKQCIIGVFHSQGNRIANKQICFMFCLGQYWDWRKMFNNPWITLTIDDFNIFRSFWTESSSPICPNQQISDCSQVIQIKNSQYLGYILKETI